MVEMTLSIILTLIVIGIVGAVKYYEKKYGTNPQAWDTNKFLTLLGVGTAIILVEYYFSGVISEFPAEDLIQQALGIFGAAYAVIFGVKAVKNYAVSGGVPTPLPAAPVSAPVWSAGFTATPAFTAVKSGTPVTFHLNAGNTPDASAKEGTVPVPNVLIDWMDGSAIEIVKMVKNFAQVTHTYTYNAAGTQYDAHSFYPEFRLLGADGSSATFNTDGKFVEVECKSLVPA